MDYIRLKKMWNFRAQSELVEQCFLSSGGQFQDHHTLCSAVHLASMATDLLTEKGFWK